MSIVYAILVMCILGAVFGVALSFADKKFAVPVDEKVQRIRENVSGANCGACGYPGCDGFAEAVAKGEAPVNGCTPGGEKSAKALAEIMGVSVEACALEVARVRCLGEKGVAKERFTYSGIQTCRAAMAFAGGPKECQYACLGLGDCERVCAFDAIKMVNGIAKIDPEKCTACGMCVKECPRSIIALLPVSSKVTVLCSSLNNAKTTKLSCSRGCIGCKRCEKACEFDAIHVVNGLAKIDPSKCTNCKACVEVCPVNCIVVEE
ncbi:MAG: RnfABCDGE type electron transport complex subunit B [Eubacteriales bacterium]|nr:RnfABCDGE type electron transport complex subunit B [Eubacteriales bacterium]